MRIRRALGRPAGKTFAVAGLAVVVLFPAALTAWTAIGSNAQVDRSVQEAEQFARWQAAANIIDEEHALVEEYTTAPSPAIRARLASTAARLDLLLEDLKHTIGLESPAESGDTLEDIAAAHAAHAQYLRVAGEVIAAVDRGEATRAHTLLHGQTEALSQQVAAALLAGAQQETTEEAEALAALQRIQRAAIGAALVALAVGALLFAGGWRLVSRSHRRPQHQALHDALTGLPNRILLADRTGQAIRLADRELVPAALLLLDLDRFKEVNDTLGHHYGDQLLLQVGQRLAAALRQVDTVARLGGDEFAVLLPRIASAEGAMAVARKLQAALEEPVVLEELMLDVEASIGVAVYPEHGSDAEELLQRADIAMYVAKQTHAGYVLFDPTQDQHSPRRLALLGELRRAIEQQQQLLLHYQPKVDAHTGQVLGVEALVRWQHPAHGLIPPGDFVPLAEAPGSSAR